MKFSFRPAALAVLLPLLLAGGNAIAQQAPTAAPGLQPPPVPAAGTVEMQPPPPAPRGAPMADDAGRAVSVLNGTVSRWLLNPGGEVDGILLRDGTQVSFAPHLSANVVQAFKPGDAIQVTGWRAPNAPVVRATGLVATASGVRIVDTPPAAGAQPPQPREPGALSAMSASGRVTQMLYSDRGDARGVILDDGTIVRFPPHAGVAMAPLLRTGSTVHARGWGSRNAQGHALEATAIGDSASTMRELFAAPGVEPGARPRARPGAGGPAGMPGPATRQGSAMPKPPPEGAAPAAARPAV